MLSPSALSDGAPGWWRPSQDAALTAFNSRPPVKRGVCGGKVRRSLPTKCVHFALELRLTSGASAKMKGYQRAVAAFWNVDLA